VYNRSVFPGGDMAGLAAFVSPTSPEGLEFSKYVAGMARTARRTGLNQNMQFGIWLFEGLRAYGMNVSRSEVQIPRELQFPAQTLAYKSGSALDVGLLYAGLLEAAGIRASLVIAGSSGELSAGDVLVAFNLGIRRDDAATAALFNGADKLFIVGDEVWLLAAVSKLNGGFMAAWEEGVRRIDAILAGEEEAEMIIFEDAWTVYPPAPFPALGMRVAQADMAQVRAGSETALQAYIANEFGPKITAVNAQIRGNPTGALYNQLGMLYLRSNMSAQAKTAYERAAGMGSAPAMMNRGNLAVNEKDYTAAERWFNQVLTTQPENAAALRGLAHVESRK